VDRDGTKVFSDLPPPADVPEKNILRKPGMRGRSVAAPAAAAKPAPDAATQAAAGMSKPGELDKELQEKKKQAADAEAAKRKAEEERVAKAKAENCARARQAKAGLDGGMRIARTNEKGEREFLDDAKRAEEASRTQAIIDQDCN
jgi:hypothetical protein